MIDCELIIEMPGIRYSLDLLESEPIPYVKTITDISNIADRVSDYTKTITLPGTNNNNDILSNIFNIARNVINTSGTNFTPDFNPSLKANCTLYKKGIPQVIGYFQLTKIEVVDEYNIKYEGVIIGRFANLFSDIADRKLSEIDLSEYNHAWTEANVTASWVAPTGEGYYYGLIDYGLGNGVTYYVDYLFPQIYAKTIWDKIFEEAGFRYESDFLTSELFKRFVVPYSGKRLRLDAASVEDRLFSANRTTDSTLTLFGVNSQRTLPFNNTVKDTSPSGYNNTTFEFTVQDTGKYNFVTSGQVYFESSAASIGYFEATVSFAKNGLPIVGRTILSQTLNPSANTTKSFSFRSGFISVVAGDVIEVIIRSSVGGSFDLSYSLLAGATFYNQHSGEIAEGDTLTLSSLLPNDINQTDFLSSIIKMFNLYVDVDKLDNKKLIIEPRDDFYNTTVVDLTQQVDVSRGVNIMPLGALEYKSYNYSFSEDGDSLNKQYQDKYTENYGTAKVRIENDFVKDEYEQKVIFAPRPLSQVSDMVITRIIFLDANGLRVESPSKISLLMVSPEVAVPTNGWTLKTRAGTSTTYNLVPYVGHLDDVSNPTYDLTFYMPREVMYTADIYTNNNLFNIYHRKGIEEISNPNSKIVEYYIKISELGLQKLSFRDYYFIDKQYYRLYSIDGDLNSEEPVKIKFLKLATAPDFVDEQVGINGGTDTIENQDTPIYNKQFQQQENVYDNFMGVSVQGTGNDIQSEGVLVNSTNNGVNGTQSTVLGGDGNQITHDGVTFIGTNDYESEREGQSVINNIDQPIGSVTILSPSELDTLNTTPVEIVPMFDGFWTELVAMYVTLFYDGETPVAYNNATLKAVYFTDGPAIKTIPSGIINETYNLKAVAEDTSNVLFLSEPVYIQASDDLGSSGNGQLKVEAHYRLHPIIQ